MTTTSPVCPAPKHERSPLARDPHAPPHLERVGLACVLAAVNNLDDVGEDALRAEVATEAGSFFAGLARYRRSRAYRGRVCEREAVSSSGLVGLLLQAASAFHAAAGGGVLDEDALSRAATECFRLAGTIGAAMEAPHPADSGVLVQIDLNGRDQGELVLVPLTSEDRERFAREREARGRVGQGRTRRT